MANSETNEDTRLSPVLNSHRINRKLFHQKKLQKKSSRVKLTERFQSTMTEDFTEIDGNTSVGMNLRDNCGFQTASGAIIKLSDVHLEKYSKLFGDILTGVETVQTENLNGSKIDDLPKITDSLYNDDSDKFFENITIIDDTIQNKPIRSNFVSFQTESNKELKLTESTIENPRKQFFGVSLTTAQSDIDAQMILQTVSSEESSVQRNSDKTTSFVGFQTASGKELKLTESALDRAAKRFSEELQGIAPPEEHSDSGGFQTVAGKGLKISQSAIEAVKKRFDKEDVEGLDNLKSKDLNSVKSSLEYPKGNSIGQLSRIEENVGFRGFQTASGKGLKLSEFAIEAAKKRFNEDFSLVGKNFEQCSKISQTNYNTNSDCGFQIASGKELKSSESAIEVANERFGEDFSTSSQIPTPPNEDSRLAEFSLENREEFARIPQLNSNENLGFQTASGKGLKLTESAIEAAKKKFNEEDVGSLKNLKSKELNLPKFPFKFSNGKSTKQPHRIEEKSDFRGFQTASGKGLALSESAIETAKKRFNEDYCRENPRRGNSEQFSTISQINYNDNSSCVGFQTASGRGLKLTATAIEAARKRFSEDFSTCHHPKDSKLAEFSFEKREEFSKIPQFNYNENASFNGFQTASGKGLKLTESAIEAAQKKFGEDLCKLPEIQISEEDISGLIESRLIDLDENLENCRNLLNAKLKSPNELNFSGFHNEEFLQSDQYLKSFKQLALGIEDIKRKCTFDSEKPSKIIKLDDSINGNSTKNNQKQLNISTDLSVSQMNRSRKRLGISLRPKIIQQRKLEQAKLIFDDLSPIKPIQGDFFNSTPVKSTVPPRRQVPLLLNSTITPIKSEEKKHKIPNEFSSNIIIQQPTGGNLDVLASVLEQQRLEFENKLKIIIAKQEALKLQNNLQNTTDSLYKLKREGVLLSKKQLSTRIKLKDLKVKSDDLEQAPIVTPQIALLIHFRNSSATIRTEDGAVIIPNSDNLIGFTEISTAFKIMPGIEPKLIPKSWLENHYKWIVWKLASYENFLENCQDCLNVENILQQLKYRYDREIDRVERPILRRILEKDDTSQKRMVLCVSNIIKLADNKFELELTDGWYSVRTVIDDVLCSQINKNKIKIGTKLMINNAELVNCDGCHPLEVPASVYLKINSNSTRRTLWHCKLGCYRISEPFPISLRSIQLSGGLIGCIKVYIARIYPIRYLEKQGKMRVWRNRRAEDRRAQEYENEKLKRIEQIQELVRKDYEKSLSNSNQYSTNLIRNKSDIAGIACGKTLFEMFESSKDPESFQELLTTTQRNSMIEFQRNVSFKKQQEINNKIKDSISKLDICQRDVTAVLKILIVDVIKENPKGFIFQIWKADDNHLETLKEGAIFRIYNVLPKLNGDLSSTSKTRFRIENVDLERFENFQRALIPISTLLNSNNKPNFNEFDTVGIIIQLSINQYDQTFWLSDGNSCMIFVKIFDNSKNCSLLDNLKSGDILSISNLIYCEKQFDFIHTIANHSTIISKYPQSKHLIEGIDRLNNELSTKDIGQFLADCKEKVGYYLDKITIVRSSSKSTVTDASLIDSTENFADDSDEESTLTSKITSLDVAMSMIDIDKFTYLLQ